MRRRGGVPEDIAEGPLALGLDEAVDALDLLQRADVGADTAVAREDAPVRRLDQRAQRQALEAQQEAVVHLRTRRHDGGNIDDEGVNGATVDSAGPHNDSAMPIIYKLGFGYCPIM
jgi:hypothetical protein